MTETTPMLGRVVRAMRARGLWSDSEAGAASTEAARLFDFPSPVFIYHAVAADDAPGCGNPYVLSERSFRRHLNAIASSVATPNRLYAVAAHAFGPRPPHAAALTFDDGCESWLRHVAPLLMERDWPATFFVVADRLAKAEGRLAGIAPLTDARLRELAGLRGRDGKPLFDIGSHGLRHEDLAARLIAVGPAQLGMDLKQSRDRIEQITGRPCVLLSIPGGKTGGDAKARRELRQVAADAGFVRVRDSLPRYDRCPHSDFLGGSPVYAHTSPAMIRFEVDRLRRGNATNAAAWVWLKSTGRWIERDDFQSTAPALTPAPPMPTRTPRTPAVARRLRLTWHVPRLMSAGCGLSRRVRDLAAGLQHRGHEVRLVVPTHATDIAGERIDGIPLFRLDLQRGRPLHWTLQARTRMQAAGQMALAIGDPGQAVLTCQPEFAAQYRARHPDAPLVLVACCSQLLYEAHDRLQAATAGALHRAARALNRWMLRRAERNGFLAASAVAFDSAMTRDIVTAAYGLDSQRGCVIQPAIDTLRFRPPTAARRMRLRRALALPRDGFVLCWTGRMEDRKNVELLLEALARVRDRVAALLLVGDGADRPALQRLSQRLELESTVRFVGMQADVLPWLHASDAFVLPSLVESFGIALLEAMSCGLPCVALRNGPCANTNAQNLIEDGRSGLLIDGPDPALLAHAIERLAASDSLRGALGTAARESVAARYAAGRDAAQLEQLLERIQH